MSAVASWEALFGRRGLIGHQRAEDEGLRVED
jgi:hypothetical protein